MPSRGRSDVERRPKTGRTTRNSGIVSVVTVLFLGQREIFRRFDFLFSLIHGNFPSCIWEEIACDLFRVRSRPAKARDVRLREMEIICITIARWLHRSRVRFWTRLIGFEIQNCTGQARWDNPQRCRLRFITSNVAYLQFLIGLLVG